MNPKLIFFGTPEFAVPTLEALCNADLTPLLVVTQPSRPAGRGGALRHPPVARWAEARSLQIRQPQSVKEPAFLEELDALEPDYCVVVAFGQIFRRRLLELPSRGCINLHGSLLPLYRGAAPVQAAIVAGDDETGVTSMVMEAGLDSGPMLIRRKTPIRPTETGGQLAERLAVLGGEVIVDTIRELEAGTLEPTPQDDDLATFAPRLAKADGVIDWTQPAAVIERIVRAYDPWPGTQSSLRGERIRILAARCAEAPSFEELRPGQLGGLTRAGLAVGTGEGVLLVDRLQRPGRKAVDAAGFVNGFRPAPDEAFEA